MGISILLLTAGLAILIFGAEWLVKGASALAKKFHVSDLVIGLTVVAFGTSAPEMVVNVLASSQGNHDIVMGNILGSNISNLFLILGITGLIYPLIVQSSTIWYEIPLSFIAVVILFFLANNFFVDEYPVITKLNALVLLMIFLLFLYYMYRQVKKDKSETDEHIQTFSNIKIWILIIAGLAGLVIGGKLVVDNAIDIAVILGVSEKIIGFTIVAVGTSLPELATSVVAAFRKNTNIAVGNIVGSNIFNILFILPVSALVNPLIYNKAFNSDMYFLSIGTLLLFIAMFTGRKRKLDRWEAALLLIAYLIYTGWLIAREV